MQYWKIVSTGGVVSVSTINENGDGNSSKVEYDIIAEMLRNAPAGYGVIETENGFDYAPIPIDQDPELDAADALEVLLGGAT